MSMLCTDRSCRVPRCRCILFLCCGFANSLKLILADFNKIPPLVDGSVPAAELAKFIKSVFER
jgi:hypothetical protein